MMEKRAIISPGVTPDLDCHKVDKCAAEKNKTEIDVLDSDARKEFSKTAEHELNRSKQ